MDNTWGILKIRCVRCSSEAYICRCLELDVERLLVSCSLSAILLPKNSF